MPKSTATYCGAAGLVTSTKMLPGCMSAWKKLWRNTCVKKISTPFSASRWMSVPAARSAVDVVDLDAEDALHRQHVRPAKVPVDLGHVQQVGAREVALQLRGIGGFAHEVELDGERPLELGDDLDGMQPMRFGPIALRERRDRVQHLHVALDQRRDVRPQHLDDDGLPVVQARGVHLRDRGRRERRARRTPRTLARRAGRTPPRARPPPARRRTAALGPAASRARPRCRAAADPGAPTAPGRTSRRSGRAPRAPCAGARRAAAPAAERQQRPSHASGRNRCVRQTISSRPCFTSTRWIASMRASCRSRMRLIGVARGA